MVSIIIAILFMFGLSESFQDNLDAYLNNHLSEYSKYSYEIITLPNNISNLNDGIDLDKSREYKLNNGYMYIPVHIQPKNGKGTNGYITLKLKLYKEVLVSINEIERGIELAESDFIKVYKDVTQLRVEAVYTTEYLSDKRTKVKISKGQVLSKNAFEQIPVIRIGDKITAYIKKGTVEISMDVKAKQDGYRNKIIRVLSDENRIYKAKVESSKKVLIVE
ncbi:MAG: flagellar basal body P-ring formation protein FlgA [Melioribacteraceae bacterium]|nr:flagellar basal body P-ring formation protein FlgA [Melioribacteraceae bacterium]